MCSRDQAISSSAVTRAGLQRDERDDLLAVRAVGSPDDARDLHRGVPSSASSTSRGIDVEAAADDQILLAVDDEQVAVVVEIADVAGVQPAVAQRLAVASGERQ